MTNLRKSPPLALTLRGYIQHAPANWRAHMAAAADAVEEVARLRVELASLLTNRESDQVCISGLRNDLDAARAERDTLRQFAKEIMLAWPDGDVDGADLEDAALTAGILIPTARTAWCGDNCSCAEVHNWDDDALPVQCLRKAAWMKDAG